MQREPWTAGYWKAGRHPSGASASRSFASARVSAIAAASRVPAAQSFVVFVSRGICVAEVKKLKAEGRRNRDAEQFGNRGMLPPPARRGAISRQRAREGAVALEARRLPRIGACSTDRTNGTSTCRSYIGSVFSPEVKRFHGASTGALGPSSIGNPDCADRAGASHCTGPLTFGHLECGLPSSAPTVLLLDNRFVFCDFNCDHKRPPASLSRGGCGN